MDQPAITVLEDCECHCRMYTYIDMREDTCHVYIYIYIQRYMLSIYSTILLKQSLQNTELQFYCGPHSASVLALLAAALRLGNHDAGCLRF